MPRVAAGAKRAEPRRVRTAPTGEPGGAREGDRPSPCVIPGLDPGTQSTMPHTVRQMDRRLEAGNAEGRDRRELRDGIPPAGIVRRRPMPLLARETTWATEVPNTSCRPLRVRRQPREGRGPLASRPTEPPLGSLPLRAFGAPAGNDTGGWLGNLQGRRPALTAFIARRVPPIHPSRSPKSNLGSP